MGARRCAKVREGGKRRKEERGGKRKEEEGEKRCADDDDHDDSNSMDDGMCIRVLHSVRSHQPLSIPTRPRATRLRGYGRSLMTLRNESSSVNESDKLRGQRHSSVVL